MSLYITENGEYDIGDYDANGFDHIIVKTQGGEGNVELTFLYNKGQELNNFEINYHHTDSRSHKNTDGIYVYYWFGGAITSNLISLKNVKRIGVAIRAVRQGGAFPFRANIGLFDNNTVATNGNDTWTTSNLIDNTNVNIVSSDIDASITSVGGIFYIDIPEGVEEGYFGCNTVNLDFFLTAVWLEN